MRELGHPLGEPDLGVYPEQASSPAGIGDDVANVPGAPAADDLGRRSVEGGR